MILKKRLGEMLLESKLLTEDQLKQILAEYKSTGLKLGQYIIRQGMLNENQIIDVLSRQLKIDKYYPDKYPLEINLAHLIPIEMAEKFRVAPLKKKGRLLTIAIIDPLDISALDAIEQKTNCEVDPVICKEREINQLISVLYGRQSGEKEPDLEFEKKQSKKERKKGRWQKIQEYKNKRVQESSEAETENGAIIDIADKCPVFFKKSGVFSLEAEMKKCPFCQEEIQDTALKCRYCGEWLSNESNKVKNADSNLLQHDQTFENDSISMVDLVKMVGNEEIVIRKVICRDGIIYHGEVSNGEFMGHGTLNFPDGTKYEGTFNKGLNGRGTMTLADGSSMNCKWRDGHIIEDDDDVTKIFPNGIKYIGSIKGGKFNGYGTLYYNGAEMYAYWENSEPIGKVTEIRPDSSKYEGELKNMLWHGKGVLSSPEGIRYEGDFMNGKFHGAGTMTDRNGKIIYSGLWKNDEPFLK